MTYLVVTIAGLLAVDCIGYLWHRWVEHGAGPLSRAHHKHHEMDYPPERFLQLGVYRKNPDPAWYIPAVLVLGLAAAILPLGLFLAFAAVTVGYAFALNGVHERFHVQGNPLERIRWFLRLRALHLNHHQFPANYSILAFWMDRLCGSYLP